MPRAPAERRGFSGRHLVFDLQHQRGLPPGGDGRGWLRGSAEPRRAEPAPASGRIANPGWRGFARDPERVRRDRDGPCESCEKRRARRESRAEQRFRSAREPDSGARKDCRHGSSPDGGPGLQRRFVFPARRVSHHCRTRAAGTGHQPVDRDRTGIAAGVGGPAKPAAGAAQSDQEQRAGDGATKAGGN